MWSSKKARILSRTGRKVQFVGFHREGLLTMHSNLSDAALWSRIQFGFTLTYHYLFPQLTMGLAWFLVYWKWRALRTGDDKEQPGRAILGQDPRSEFRRGSGDRHSHGVSVRNELGGVFEVCGWRDRADAGD